MLNKTNVFMENKNYGDPNRAYREELNEKGSTFTDTHAESEARDKAKIEKAATGQSQKMDGGNPHAEEDTVSDEEIRRETLEKK
ncbi:hypothetical protein GCM10023229_30220 [Flavisolibacter ginsenosidimutans]